MTVIRRTNIKQDALKIAWTNTLSGVGVAFGYSNHQKQLKQALSDNGVIFDHKSQVQVSIVPANNFVRVPDKFNVLYTMYEATDIPKSWIPKIQGADLIVVPCEHNKKLFRKYTNKPIEVCLEGVLTDKFSYVDRFFPKNKAFRFLWFGASNQRKGYQFAIASWRLFQIKYPEIAFRCELYMKTTQSAECEHIVRYENGQPIKEVMPKERIFKTKNAIVDTRRVTEEELTQIYHDSHCFLFPTMGEGFGLTLAEAMSTGLPCIYTPWSGPRDFISIKEGYPLKFTMAKVESQIARMDGNHITDCQTHAASPDIDHMVRRMVQVYSDYETALKKGKRAADRIRREITWTKSAKRFEEIIRRYV